MEQIGQPPFSVRKGTKPTLHLFTRHQRARHTDESSTQPEQTILVEPGKPSVPLSLVLYNARQVVPRYPHHPGDESNLNLSFICWIDDGLKYLLQLQSLIALENSFAGVNNTGDIYVPQCRLHLLRFPV